MQQINGNTRVSTIIKGCMNVKTSLDTSGLKRRHCFYINCEPTQSCWNIFLFYLITYLFLFDDDNLTSISFVFPLHAPSVLPMTNLPMQPLFSATACVCASLCAVFSPLSPPLPAPSTGSEHAQCSFLNHCSGGVTDWWKRGMRRARFQVLMKIKLQHTARGNSESYVHVCPTIGHINFISM